MDLSTNQLQTLKAAIFAEPTLATAISTGDDPTIAAWLNTVLPAYIVWRSSVTTREMLENVTWTEVDGLTNGKARIFEWMMTLPAIDAGVNKVRQGLSDCFGSTSASYTSILVILKRSATRAESLLANGTGTDASPSKLRAEGTVTPADASRIRTA